MCSNNVSIQLVQFKNGEFYWNFKILQNIVNFCCFDYFFAFLCSKCIKSVAIDAKRRFTSVLNCVSSYAGVAQFCFCKMLWMTKLNNTAILSASWFRKWNKKFLSSSRNRSRCVLTLLVRLYNFDTFLQKPLLKTKLSFQLR